MPDSVPLVSVIIATYNGGVYLPFALESVLGQSMGEFEFIVVDDCSDDETPDIIRSIDDQRLVYTRNTENLGQTASLNLGLSRARGELVARIDADDIWHPEKLERQCAFMAEHPDVTVCGTWADRIDACGDVVGIYSPPTDPLEIRYRLLWTSPVCHVSVLMRRATILECGGYPAKYRFAADYALWSEVLRAGHAIANLPRRLTQFREMPETFGTANKIGAAGDETSEVIQLNAHAIAGLDLDYQQCRNIALMFYPPADLNIHAIDEAYVNLRSMAEATFGSPPLQTRLELLGILFWSIFKRATLVRRERGVGAYRREWWTILKTFGGRPAALIVAMGGLILSIAGPGPGQWIKAWATASIKRIRAAPKWRRPSFLQ